jgi:hypothetical protein
LSNKRRRDVNADEILSYVEILAGVVVVDVEVEVDVEAVSEGDEKDTSVLPLVVQLVAAAEGLVILLIIVAVMFFWFGLLASSFVHVK